MRRILIAVLGLLFATCAQAQTGSVKTQTQLNTEIGTTGCSQPTCLWPDNTTGLITPFDLRQVGLDLTSTLFGVQVPPSVTIYGSAVIQSGLIPTWPTAPINGCTINAAGTGYTGTPTGNVAGGITIPGTAGGGSITLTQSGGAINSCAVNVGGSYSYPPVYYISSNPGSGANLASSLGNTNTFTTSAGVIIVNGSQISVLSYTHTYATVTNTTTAYCDFVSLTTGTITTTAAVFGSGNFGCSVAPGGSTTLRVVWVQNGTGTGSGGFINGVTQIQYFIPMVAGFGYFATNTKDGVAQQSAFPGGNASATGLNFPCMQGQFGSRFGNCSINANYMQIYSNDSEPQANTNILDGGPIMDFIRQPSDGSPGRTGNLLQTSLFKGLDGGGNIIQYGEHTTRVTNSGTGGSSYTDSAGERDFYTKQSDGLILRMALGGGFYTPSLGGQNGGQFPGISGCPAIVDKGPSTFNMCGLGTNIFGNPPGYYLHNNLILSYNTLSLGGLTSGFTTLQPASIATGTLTMPSATDTLVGRATTDTLTNKSIDGSEINSGTLSASVQGNGFGTRAILIGANLNTTADQSMTIPLPTGTTHYSILTIQISNPSISMTTAVCGIWTGAGKTGTTIIGSGASGVAMSGLTNNAAGSNGSMIVPTINNNTSAFFAGTTVFFACSTPQGATATADVRIDIRPLN